MGYTNEAYLENLMVKIDRLGLKEEFNRQLDIYRADNPNKSLVESYDAVRVVVGI